jgi:hypothetical protein
MVQGECVRHPPRVSGGSLTSEEVSYINKNEPRSALAGVGDD